MRKTRARREPHLIGVRTRGAVVPPGFSDGMRRAHAGPAACGAPPGMALGMVTVRRCHLFSQAWCPARPTSSIYSITRSGRAWKRSLCSVSHVRADPAPCRRASIDPRCSNDRESGWICALARQSAARQGAAEDTYPRGVLGVQSHAKAGPVPLCTSADCVCPHSTWLWGQRGDAQTQYPCGVPSVPAVPALNVVVRLSPLAGPSARAHNAGRYDREKALASRFFGR